MLFKLPNINISIHGKIEKSIFFKNEIENVLDILLMNEKKPLKI